MSQDNAKYEFLAKYAWQYFEYHANQRITLFRYYIIFFTFIATGAGILYVNFSHDTIIHEIAGIILSIAFAIITIVFHCLDYRNSRMVELAEYALKDIEATKLFSNGDTQELNKNNNENNFRIFTNDKNPWINHKRCFYTIFTLAYILSVLYLLTSIVLLCYYCHHA